ncbi:hypothetical protein GcM1_247051 [Golovinomyces cichoracearum]|uniref:Dna polymerase iii subunits gamma and tau n=1 Tax=Golovinomyces cichoracearum TaxID=62708 RepID=A0A420IDF5_9PEZI|nr:hypothetical protein GcM1_247051 [Golovinomyces cichoracearum]
MLINNLPVKKRHRQEADQCISGLGEHHTKRRNPTATHQIPPNLDLPNASNLSCCTNNSQELSSCTVTLQVRNSENDLSSSESKLFLLSYQPSSSPTTLPCGNPLSSYSNRGEGSTPSCPNLVPGNPNFVNDIEMMESFQVLPGPLYHDMSPVITGGRSKEIQHSSASLNLDNEADKDFINSISKVNLFERNSRLHKSVIERDTSPSVIVTGLSDMQMDVEDIRPSSHDFELTTRNGHVKAKENTRPLDDQSCGSSESCQIKRSFSMGYRTNCDKCRLKVPGHFSHIITS